LPFLLSCRLHRVGASLWQEAGAPAGWADGQVGTSHLVHAASMRPTHATARNRAIQVLRLAHVRKAKPRNTLDQRALEFFVRHRLKLARAVNLRTLDTLTAEHALFLDRGDRSAELRLRVFRFHHKGNRGAEFGRPRAGWPALPHKSNVHSPNGEYGV
jgi:hypothetical protein